ncbi:MAG TPA: PspC domain-containing protein [Jatrophihabitans sp.]|jgi:phage shock protein PspC (stress-responsive transcriptional regulator)
MTSTANGTTTPQKRLRRSTTDRIAGGIAGGLGEYFGLDPILFRILFAVSAFFGGAGLLAYLIAWAAIPADDAQHARIDDWVGGLRTWRVPSWTVLVVAGLVIWSAGFSWWAPRPFLPLLVVVVVAILLLSRVERRGHAASKQPPPVAAVSPEISEVAATAEVPPLDSTPQDGTPLDGTPLDSTAPDSTAELARSIADEAAAEVRGARQRRRSQVGYVRTTAIAVLIATLTVLGISDAVAGIRLPVYFWVSGGIVLAALLIGSVLRRTPWSLLPLLVLSLIGIIGFGNTAASLHDGVGQKVWVPTSEAELTHSQRLAFGQTVIDLRHVTASTTHRIDVTQGAGQVRILVPATMQAVVFAHVRFGDVSADGSDVWDNYGWGPAHRGVGIDQTIPPASDAAGPEIDIYVHLADGHISVEHS